MTKTLYLQDTYLFTSIAIILKEIDTEKGYALILDQTIFYPQGGGQPADSGFIVYSEGVFCVTDARLNENGEVLHYGHWEGKNAPINTPVSLSINQEKRILNARNHSAGHLLDIAIENLGYHFPHSKSYHFADSPYIEYIGKLENVDVVKELLDKELQELIRKSIPVNKQILSAEECKKRNISIPAGKEGRIVTFMGHKEVGCGGTHVENSEQIGEVHVTKISSKKDIVRISYKII